MKKLLILPLAFATALAGAATRIVQDQCGPFTDVSPAICPYVLEMYYLGITAGTSPTTYSPDNPVTRGQAAVFVTKGVNQAIARSSSRAALGQWWSMTGEAALGLTNLGGSPRSAACDGADVWVSDYSNGTVSRVRASDGRLLETWTGAEQAGAVLVAMGRVFVTGTTQPGRLYMLDPSQAAGAVTTVASNLGDLPAWIAFDGGRIWTANSGTYVTLSTVSIVEPSAIPPWAVTTVGPYDFVEIQGIAFDGTNMWLSRFGGSDLLRLDSNGAVLQDVPLGEYPRQAAFDGANLWVPLLPVNSQGGSLAVVSAATGTVVATLTGNGLDNPFAAAFDGQRVLVANSPTSVSLWRAADLTPLGTLPIASGPGYPCSDGINFWFPSNDGHLIRF
jgi:hypothetical protein